MGGPDGARRGYPLLARLRGAPPVSVAGSRTVLLLLLGGMVPSAAGEGSVALRVRLSASGALELAGARLALRVLARILRSGPPLAEHAGLRPVLSFFLAGFGAFCLALDANLMGVTIVNTRWFGTSTCSAGGDTPRRADCARMGSHSLAKHGVGVAVELA